MRLRCGWVDSSAESSTRAKAMSALAGFFISGSTSCVANTAATAASVCARLAWRCGLVAKRSIGAERGLAQHLVGEHAPFALVLD